MVNFDFSKEHMRSKLLDAYSNIDTFMRGNNGARSPAASAQSVSSYNTSALPDERQAAIEQQRQQANPAYDKIMAAPDPRREAITSQRAQSTGNKLAALPVADTAPSAYDVYQKMVAQFNPDQMSKDQYAPQYAMLDKLNKDAKARYNTNDKQMGGMYSALQGAIKGDATGISKNYDTAAADLKSNYDTLNANTTAREDGNRAKTEEMLKRLGIQEAAPNMMKTANDSSNMWEGIRNTANQRANTSNTERKTSSLNYNNTMQQKAGFEGAAQRSGLMGQLNDFTNANEVKRLGVASDQSKTSADYKMKQMDMYSKMAEQQGSNDSSAFKAAQDQKNWEDTFAQKERAANASTDATARKQMTPYDKLAEATKGTGIWGPTDVAGITKLIADAYGKANLDSSKSKDMNGQEFIQNLLAANPGLESQAALRKLGTQYFNDSYSGK
jgi:hypothetical protein